MNSAERTAILDMLREGRLGMNGDRVWRRSGVLGKLHLMNEIRDSPVNFRIQYKDTTYFLWTDWVRLLSQERDKERMGEDVMKELTDKRTVMIDVLETDLCRLKSWDRFGTITRKDRAATVIQEAIELGREMERRVGST